jgi:NAD(P)-dependent dehydrogenase (short-subunit alcohol dehydrogenase family)/1-acyl-sn-glycerol-3-phosphate acyltransferase
LKKSLNEAALHGRSYFVTVTRFDGKLGLGAKNQVFSKNGVSDVISGGLFGLTKTLNQEWEQVNCRAIDLSPDLEAQTAAQHIIAELYDPNLLISEVGYSLQGRTTLVADKSATTNNRLPPQLAGGNQPNADAVFLVSGGGRGITAQCVIRMAKAFHCKFILLGRTKLIAEPVYAQGCLEETELKKRIIAHLKSQGEKPTPVKVQKLLKGIAAQREIEETLQAIEQAGGHAEYVSVDITNAQSLVSMSNRFGPITGILHGAGVLADKLIEHKSEQDFERVYVTKVEGLQTLLSSVNVNQLQHLILFSSAAGFFGNIGQADYAIANEILNKFAHEFKREHPACHVVAFDWGPWDGGMVTPELKQMFAQRNIEVIPLEVGTQIVVDHLKAANHPETVQILVGGSLVTQPSALVPDLHSYRIRRTLSLDANPFLQDHIIGGHVVLPTTCAIAWLINICEQLSPGYTFFACDKLKVFKGIVFDDSLANEYILDLKEIDKTANEIKFDATIWSETATGKPLYHYSGQISLLREIPSAPIYETFDNRLDDSVVNWLPYQDGTLFHGPRFQGIKRVLNISPKKLTIECLFQPVDEKQRGQFPMITFDPIGADAQFQSMLVWVRQFYQAGSLPLRCERGELFQPVPEGETLYVSLDIQSSTDTKLVANITSHDSEGRMYSQVLGAEVTISKQLNPLFLQSSVPEKTANFLQFWRDLLGVSNWLGEKLLIALFRRFVGEVVRADNVQALKDKPVLYLANHQVGVESILFTFGVSALAGNSISVVVKMEHKDSWISHLFDHLYSYPTIKDPELMFYFDRDDRRSMFKLLEAIKRVMIEQGHSLLVHVEGSRALSCQEPVKSFSNVFIDLAIDLDIPIVPVGFVGGLPIEPLETRLEFPVGYTRQDYHLGSAIYPETLKRLPYAQRKVFILERLNELAQIAMTPHAADPDFEQKVRSWMEQTGKSETKTVLYKVLEELSEPTPEIRTLLQGIREGYLDLSDSPEDRWLGEFGRWLSDGQIQIS